MKKVKFFLFLFILLGLFLFIIQFLNGYFGKRVDLYIHNKTTLYASSYIEEALRKEVTQQIDVEHLYQMKTNDEQVVTAIYINTREINQILSRVHQSIQTSLTSLEEETLKLPLGIVFSETLFSHLGPNIHIKIVPVGSYTCDVLTHMDPYGINNSLFQISIQIEIHMDTILPLKKGNTTVQCNIPLVVQVLQGTVPRYYYNTDQIIPDVLDN